ncbi:class I SAM-dependent methyltransferase [Bosea sp. (in: a-proteobacteria)]|uniref:class I SAM-dependent methyltransferase n=1 Tax=Bosea sp. (in: a-proteobacteria) TaxID=1871050 RepID=UPI002734B8AA|nr:class I SAM-dependent methyltransferase [Bosea sp. (in: a-proteobacteria)]MDP3255841.1 class I SAM-dependent methyltransferase [Bosea sp. (in: a-proteobacteria)]
MDAIYRHQRHIYDASRKFYLLGRDRLIDDLAPPEGGSVLEIGCGTGRNLVRIAQAYPGRACFGLDVSSAMLETARRSVGRAGLADRIALTQADATAFDPQALFGRAGFDRIVISYALSMIPPWQGVVEEALRRLAPGGELHIVDFGDQRDLPRPFGAVLNRWLALFHVTPRRELAQVLADAAVEVGATLRATSLHGGYAALAVLKRVG